MKNKLLFFIFLYTLTACQSGNNIQSNRISIPPNLYLDTYFISPKNFYIETEEDVFMLDAEMLSVVDKNLRDNGDIEERAKALLEQIFSQNKIALNYASNANVTAQEAFHSKEANCMSLTILAYALAKEANFNIDFQQVQIPEYWVRNGKYNMLVGHINLLIKQNKNFKHTLIKNNKVLQIDFDPNVSKEHFKKVIINKKTVLAMYYNNKGVDALTSKNYVVAYYYFKEATIQAPYFSTAWGNLGVLYRFTNHNKIAKQVYRHTIKLDEDNLTAQSNLALLLRANNQFLEADKIDANIYKKRIRNPFYHALLASEAFYQEEYRKSIAHYKKAIKLNDQQHEFYFGLAKSYFKIQNLALAKKAIKNAIKFYSFNEVNEKYVAKLNLYQHSKPD